MAKMNQSNIKGQRETSIGTLRVLAGGAKGRGASGERRVSLRKKRRAFQEGGVMTFVARRPSRLASGSPLLTSLVC